MALELRLRHEVAVLIIASGKQGFVDHPVASDLALLDEASVWVDDERQWRSGTDFERRSLAYQRVLAGRVVGARGRTGGVLSFEEEERLRASLLTDVRVFLLGHGDADFFDVVCWNEANRACEGRMSRRRPIRTWPSTDPGRLGLLGPLGDARVRFEDEPDSRDEVNDEIRSRLADYLERSGWPWR